MIPTIATEAQIKSGNARKHGFGDTCMSCYPKSCHCPPTPQDVLAALQSYLSELKNILTDEEKAQAKKDIGIVQATIAHRQAAHTTLNVSLF